MTSRHDESSEAERQYAAERRAEWAEMIQRRQCTRCGGNGEVPGMLAMSRPNTCPKCNGTGEAR